LVRRGRPRWLLIRCPDGCGEVIPLNLDRRAGPAWTVDRRGEVWSLYPSVWRETGCESHFVIWRSQIWWGLEWENERREPELENRILTLLRTLRTPLDPVEIASHLDLEPWTVSTVCRRLTAEKLLVMSGPRTYPKFASADSDSS
jgi:hypothetical protein